MGRTLRKLTKEGVELLEKNMDVKKYIEMDEAEKWWKKNEGFAEEVNDVPLCVNKTTTVKNSEFAELHSEFCKLVYEFMCKHDIPSAFHLSFGIDNIDLLKKYGSECSVCDTDLTIFDENRKVLICSI